MKSLGKWLAVAAGVSAIAAGSVHARDWNVIKDSGTMIVATEGAFYPFNYFEGSRLTGFEGELAQALVKQLGLRIEWWGVSFDAQLASIRRDRFDFAIASHGYTEERANALDSGRFGISRKVSQAHIGGIWNPIKPVDIGVEYIRGRRETLAGEKGSMSRINALARYNIN